MFDIGYNSFDERAKSTKQKKAQIEELHRNHHN